LSNATTALEQAKNDAQKNSEKAEGERRQSKILQGQIDLSQLNMTETDSQVKAQMQKQQQAYSAEIEIM